MDRGSVACPGAAIAERREQHLPSKPLETDLRTAGSSFLDDVPAWRCRLRGTCRGAPARPRRAPAASCDMATGLAAIHARSTSPLAEAPRHGHRPLQAAPANRRGRHGRGLHGRADRAGRAARGAEDHQAGHGHAAGDRPVRGRAAGPGDDGPPEHRQGARRRHDRQRAGPTS